MDPYCFHNGEVKKVSEAKVSVIDIGMLRGYGIYEGITTYNGRPFRFDDHCDRFELSAKALKLKIPYTRKELAGFCDELIKRNGFPRTNLRFILTGGNAIGGIEFKYDTPTFYILSEEHKRLPEALYSGGAHLILYEHMRAYPEYKTINYITAVMLQDERKKKEAIEILFHYDDKILEAATSNFFIVKHKKLITPKKNVLAGITRKVVMELARGVWEVEERDISLDEMYKADEAFITASYKEVVPIVSIDNKKIADGKVGAITVKVMKKFKEITG